MKRIAIEEIGGVSESQSAQVLVQNSSDKTPVSDCSLLASGKLHGEKRTHHVNGPLVEVESKVAAGDSLQAKHLAMQSKAEHSSPCLNGASATGNGDADSRLMVVPQPANNSILFQSHWKSLKKNRSLLAKYFQVCAYYSD